jgi:hypothetical protein
MIFILIAIIGAILGGIFWSQMLRANQITAAATLAQTELMFERPPLRLPAAAPQLNLAQIHKLKA